MIRRLTGPKLIHTLLISVWTFFFLVYLLYPGKPVPFSMRGFYLSLGFYLLMLATSFFLSWIFKAPSLSGTTTEKSLIPETVRLCFYLGLLGLIFHLYDKVFLREYDYLSCLDVRELWLREGAQRGLKASSLWSALGHLLVYFSVIPLLFLPINRKTLFSFSVSLLVLLIFSWTLFSRSTLILVLFMTLAGSVLQFIQNKIQLRDLLIKVIGLALCFCLFTFATFYKKITCAETASIETFSMQALTKHSMALTNKVNSEGAASSVFVLEDRLMGVFFNQLKAKVELPVSWFEGESRLTYLANIVPLYATVGINNFNLVTFTSFQPDQKYLLNPFILVINRAFQTELIRASSARSFFGLGYINFPGAVYLTFGKFGLYFVSFVLGLILFSFSRHLVTKTSRSYFLLPVFSLFFSFLLLSPITNPFSLMSVPFLFFVSFVFYFVSVFRNRSN